MSGKSRFERSTRSAFGPFLTVYPGSAGALRVYRSERPLLATNRPEGGWWFGMVRPECWVTFRPELW